MTHFVHVDSHIDASIHAPTMVADAGGAPPLGPARTPPRISALVIAEAARSAVGLPVADGARLLIELALAGGGWTAGSLAGSVASGPMRTRASSGPLADLGDQMQWEHGEGPTHDVLRTDAMEITAVTPTDLRWPTWTPAARELGVRAAMAIRLHVGRPVGAMTLYAPDPVAAGDCDLQLVRTVAAQLSILVDAADTRHHLERALDTRTTIGQAVGILMHRYHLPGDRAFALLRRASQHNNVRIAALAMDLVENGVLPTISGTGLEPPGPVDRR